jgi:alpha-tubulin suppressor-like RCC1 family protein
MKHTGSSFLLSAASRYGLLMAVLACGREFPVASELAVSLEADQWPDTLTVTDSADLSIRIVAADGRLVTGALVSWASSDPSILDLASAARGGDGTFDSLAARLRVRVRARRIGDVQISATIEEGGALRRAVLTRPINVQARWISVSAGYQHSCGVTVTNDAYCWGGGLRLLGNGSSAGSPVPARVVGGLPFARVSAGWEHSCGTLLDGLMYCWGYNPFGALGSGTRTDQLAPGAVAFGPRFKSFGAGLGYTCGVSDINTAVCWGDNSSGQISSDAADSCGATQASCSLVPVVVRRATGDPFVVSAVSAGEKSTCAIDPSGRAFCWGDNSSGQISSDAADSCGATQAPCSLVPVVVRRATGDPFVVSAVSAGEKSTCAIDPSGRAFCWGDNTLGTLGTGDQRSSPVPVPVASSNEFRSVSVGGYHACAIALDGRAWCWGTNLFGELGSQVATESCGNLSCATRPVLVSTNVSFREISVRGRSSCAIATTGDAWCWGLNDHGQLGSVTTESCAGRACSTTPRRVDGGLRFESISVGKAHACGTATNGGAYCWGQHTDGALGITTSSDVGRPMRVASPRD